MDELNEELKNKQKEIDEFRLEDSPDLKTLKRLVKELEAIEYKIKFYY